MTKGRFSIHLGTWTSPSGQAVAVHMTGYVNITVETPEGELPREDRSWFLEDVWYQVRARMEAQLKKINIASAQWAADPLCDELSADS